MIEYIQRGDIYVGYHIVFWNIFFWFLRLYP